MKTVTGRGVRSGARSRSSHDHVPPDVFPISSFILSPSSFPPPCHEHCFIFHPSSFRPHPFLPVSRAIVSSFILHPSSFRPHPLETPMGRPAQRSRVTSTSFAGFYPSSLILHPSKCPLKKRRFGLISDSIWDLGRIELILFEVGCGRASLRLAHPITSLLYEYDLSHLAPRSKTRVSLKCRLGRVGSDPFLGGASF